MNARLADATMVQEDGLYVYCVTGGGGGNILGPIGLNAQVVYLVGNGDLRAVVHSCQARPYQSQDPCVVEGWVVAHQAVVLAAAEAFGAVLPMAFDMIVRAGPSGTAVEALGDWLEERRGRFTQLLERLAGKAEYGVQVLCDREEVASLLVRSDPELRGIQQEAQGKPKGMAHLLGQKLAKAVRSAMECEGDRYAQDFYARIRRCVDDVRVDKLKMADSGKQMLLNLSCLMQKGSGELGAVLEDIQRIQGISVRFTGPWPPYSFVGG